jgi:hypothetical protein
MQSTACLNPSLPERPFRNLVAQLGERRLQRAPAANARRRQQLDGRRGRRGCRPADQRPQRAPHVFLHASIRPDDGCDVAVGQHGGRPRVAGLHVQRQHGAARREQPHARATLLIACSRHVQHAGHRGLQGRQLGHLAPQAHVPGMGEQSVAAATLTEC